MTEKSIRKNRAEQSETSPKEAKLKDTSRRAFMGQVGAAAGVAAAALAAPSVASAQSASRSTESSGAALPATVTNNRIIEAFELRVAEATEDALVPPAVNISNGDTALYPDKAGTYTKCLPHDGFGRVNLAAFQTFQTALASGKFSDFENIIVGGTRTLNGPQAGLAFDLERLDSVQ